MGKIQENYFQKKKIIIGIINAIDSVSAKAFNIMSAINVNTDNFRLGSRNFNTLLTIIIQKYINQL